MLKTNRLRADTTCVPADVGYPTDSGLERSSRFRKLIKWRTGSEGRISALKRSWGWSKSLMDGLDDAKVWCGYGIFANNSQKISGLIADKERPARPGDRRRAVGAGPPRTAKPPPAPPVAA